MSRIDEEQEVMYMVALSKDYYAQAYYKKR
jgi:hypothetical protein